MRSQLRLYEHPDFNVDEKDMSLFTTICFVLGLAVTGALLVLMMSCLLLWDECDVSHGVFVRPKFVPVHQLLSQ
ncbi:hypothetical protein WOLCODRAFT_161512 [Wolfiporia cocos MD-104 SS10]|uniref:Uncharacterized protein n=1 Tax=Wolfiporia cocos (strain MD-104) TaxID=742152 RepID=A0A2H3J8V5_WOLCO|nr:hypothetical protein WOLCODRAFT_161512 [Wolfiporia cocos MD-104 SS10]